MVEPDFDTKPSPVDGMPEDINTTDHNGQVVVHVYANGEAGSATVTAASGSIRTSVPLRVVPWAAHATVTITHTTLTADSGQAETVTARVTDKNGSPIEGLTLFPCTGEPNSLNVPVTMRLVTDANGEVHYDITPGNMPSLAAYLGVDDPRTHPWVVEVQVNYSNH